MNRKVHAGFGPADGGSTTRKLVASTPSDWYVVVLCNYSKEDARCLKQAMAEWLKEELGLIQHPEKTQITHWSKRFRFLGYDLKGQRNLNGTHGSDD